MELTKGQLRALLQCDMYTLATTNEEDIRRKLEQWELLRHITIYGATVWYLTALGLEVLRRNMSQALLMLPFHYTELTIMRVREHFTTLSIKDLPPLLCASNNVVREYARERMDQLTYDT